MKTRFYSLLATLLCSSAAVCAATDTVDTEKGPAADQRKGSVWVNVGGFSSHFNREKGYNEQNAGIGIEYAFHSSASVMVGSYYNSLRKQTTYAAVNWQPITIGPVKVGAALGVMDGYPAIQRGGTFFAALPMATYESKVVGVNFGVIPTMNNVDGAVILQFKFRIN